MRISDWSSDVCSSDRNASATLDAVAGAPAVGSEPVGTMELDFHGVDEFWSRRPESWRHAVDAISGRETWISSDPSEALKARLTALGEGFSCNARSEEHTSELQSLMRISYAVFCLKKKTNQQQSCMTHTKGRE